MDGAGDDTARADAARVTELRGGLRILGVRFGDRHCDEQQRSEQADRAGRDQRSLTANCSD